MFLDVSEQVARLDEVIARIEIAGMFQCERQAAGFRVDAQTWGLPDPVGECDVEHLDVDLADVASDPLLEDIDQEAPVLRRADRPPRHDLTLLDVERPVAPRLPGNGSVLGLIGGHPLDDRNELDEAGATFIAKKAI